MKNIYPILVLLLGSFLVPRIHAQTVNPDFLDGELYLKVEDSSLVELDPLPNIPTLTTLLGLYGVDTIYRPFQTADPVIQKIYRLEFTDLVNTGNLISGLAALPFIEYAEGVPLIETTYLPNDLQPIQYHLPKIDAALAWDISRGDTNVVVAIVDNAVLTTHEDIAPVLWRNPSDPPNGFDDDFNGYVDDYHGADVADLDGNPNPPANGGGAWDHGTHCAGIASAKTDNGKGVASIGFNLRVMAVKASASSTGGNTLERAFEGVDYAVSAGATVISMSWGSRGNTITGGLIADMARNRGVVLIAAAGNNNETDEFYPAAYNSVLAVGSTNAADQKSGFSNYGSYIDVMAPGTGIYAPTAANDSAYGTLSGTSMACPLVAGLAGLLLSSEPGLSPAQVQSRIEAGCVNIDALNPQYMGQLGAGRINAFNTLSNTGTFREEAAAVRMDWYPNPVEDRLWLVGEASATTVVRLWSLEGKLMQEVRGLDLEQGISVADWPRGLYLGQVLRQGQEQWEKIVVR